MLQAPRRIVTDRLVLRMPAASDAPAVLGYAGDLEVMRCIDFATHRSIDESHAFLRRCAEGWASGAEQTWAITRGEGKPLIGVIACRVHGHAADFGYVLHRAHWGAGLATEAARAVVAWAASLEAVHRVWATCDADNLRSVRVLEKAGLEREGLLPRASVRANLGGPPRDTLLYAKVREE